MNHHTKITLVKVVTCVYTHLYCIFVALNKHWDSTLIKMLWVFSSVGLERYLDRVEVTGSNPVSPTKKYVLIINTLQNLKVFPNVGLELVKTLLNANFFVQIFLCDVLDIFSFHQYCLNQIICFGLIFILKISFKKKIYTV